MNRLKSISVAVILMFCCVRPASAEMISTLSSWNGSDHAYPFGYPNTATYGQTITVPADGNTQLDSFSFEMELPTSLVFRGEVYAWNGSEATGLSLFESPQMTTTENGGYQLITFNTGGIDLTGGNQYVLFASISKDYLIDQSAGSGTWGYVSGNAYSGGQFVYINNGGDTSQWTSTSWFPLQGDPSLAFQADFSIPSISAVPAPSSVLLLGIGILCMGGFAWRRHWLATARAVL